MTVNRNLVGLGVGDIVIGNSVTIATRRRMEWNQYGSARFVTSSTVVNVGF